MAFAALRSLRDEDLAMICAPGVRPHDFAHLPLIVRAALYAPASLTDAQRADVLTLRAWQSAA